MSELTSNRGAVTEPDRPAHRNCPSRDRRRRSMRKPAAAAPLTLPDVVADGIVTPPPDPGNDGRSGRRTSAPNIGSHP